jgi:nicotinamide riboside transporter PnuC
MVEYLGLTGDARGIDVLVFFTFSFLAQPHASFFFFLPHRSMILFLASILSFVWFKGSGNDPSSRAPATAALGPRVVITGLLVLGMVYFAMIMKTLMRYGKERGEMRADVEMSLGVVPVQSGEPEDRGRET